MPLLPQRLNCADPIPALGEKIVREVVKVDPNAWFDEIGRQNPDDKPLSQVIPDRFGHTHTSDCECMDCIPRSGAAQASTATPAISAKPEAAPLFKVGGRVRMHYESGTVTTGTITEASRFYEGEWNCTPDPGDHGRGAGVFRPNQLELLEPSQPTQDGWIAHTHGTPCPIPGVEDFEVTWRRKDGSTYPEIRDAALSDYYWTDSSDGEVIAFYRVIA